MKKGLVHTFRLHKEKLLRQQIESLKDRANLIIQEHDKVFFNDFLIVPDTRQNTDLVKEYCERRREERTQILEKIDLLEKELSEVQRLLEVTQTNHCSQCHCKTDFLGEIVYNLAGETVVNVCLSCIDKIHSGLDKQFEAELHARRTNPFRNMSSNDIDEAFKNVCDHCGYGFLTAAYCPVCEKYNEREF